MDGARVTLVLLLDAVLAGAGGWLIYDHVRQPPTPTAPIATAAPTAAPAPDPAPPVPAPVPVPVPDPTPTPPKKAEAPKPAAPPPERPQPQRPVTVPSSGKLPDKPKSVPVQTFPDAGPPGLPPILSRPPRQQPDAAPPPPPEPEPQPPDAATPAAAEPGGPDPWVESMTRGVRNVVEGHRELIEDCYARAAKEGTRDQPIQGRVEVHLRIMPTGDAEDVRVVENQTGSDELGTCLTTIMRTWRYPAPGEEPMELVWPFNFQARSNSE